MKRYTTTILAAVAASFMVHANLTADTPQASSQRATRLEAQVPVELDYLLYLPKDYEEQESWPLMLFLHGAGERGDDLNLVKKHGPPKLIDEGKEFPFIVVSPQCRLDRWWQPIELTALLDELVGKYRVDEDRIYLTGLSMGGFGTWSLIAYSPKRFAAAAPICGGGEPYRARLYTHLPIWVFHGGKDALVLPARSQMMVDAIEKLKGNVTYTLYPNADHNSWTKTYANPELYEWFLRQKRSK